MIRNYKQIDPKIEKIVKIFENEGFYCKYFSNDNIKIVDNNMTNSKSTGEIGSITINKEGKVTVKLSGCCMKQKIKYIMHKTECVFKPGKLLLEIGAETRILIKKYKNAIKQLSDEYK